MSDLQIFAVGAVVTILVAIAIIPLVWAAILDGRDEEASRVALEGRTRGPRADGG